MDFRTMMTAILFNLVGSFFFNLKLIQFHWAVLRSSIVACIYISLHLTRTHNFFSLALFLAHFSFSTTQLNVKQYREQNQTQNKNNCDYPIWLEFFLLLLLLLFRLHFDKIWCKRFTFQNQPHITNTANRSSPEKKVTNILLFFSCLIPMTATLKQKKLNQIVFLSKWKPKNLTLFIGKLGTEQSAIKLNERVWN